ncbi:hypothetical protein CKAN_00328500 [Cinnamomum micranthum f. kanehirae]|uniref:Uncharacterized protein n=1 Tax=Cinnamomum micranthum f. kanehirae TaxID=337451 RepID=A0A443N8W7_9MAGN|nr:hypothetical protein CKAN_00328500 [Cinnamomum micranthum f. kanehirae]
MNTTFIWSFDRFGKRCRRNGDTIRNFKPWKFLLDQAPVLELIQQFSLWLFIRQLCVVQCIREYGRQALKLHGRRACFKWVNGT